MGKYISLKLRYLLSQKTKICLFPSDPIKYSMSSGEKNTPIRSQETEILVLPLANYAAFLFPCL